MRESGAKGGRHCGQRVTPVLIVIPAIMEGWHPPTASRPDPECRSGGHDPALAVTNPCPWHCCSRELCLLTESPGSF
ncbi:hypothetical protein E2C01_021311 [Portunus trituberculatus]|uniref:Uncharacterized protein n=1 Tax=Portunus trituberculatus TaxID=210409 RepID=A0A5B7E4L4_PORTR|nr:hypothetical protein [Portunus trituberculatus]